MIYVNNKVVSTLLWSLIVVKSKTKCLSSQSATHVLTERDSIYYLLASSCSSACNLLLPVLLWFADAAHLLLPHRYGQLFFQRQPRIKSRWVLAFLTSMDVSSSWHRSMREEKMWIDWDILQWWALLLDQWFSKMLLNEAIIIILHFHCKLGAYLAKLLGNPCLGLYNVLTLLQRLWRHNQWVQGFPLGCFDL